MPFLDDGYDASRLCFGAAETAIAFVGARLTRSHKIEFSFLKPNLMVPAGHPPIFNMQEHTKIGCAV
jgi:hypothetical protein